MALEATVGLSHTRAASMPGTDTGTLAMVRQATVAMAPLGNTVVTAAVGLRAGSSCKVAEATDVAGQLSASCSGQGAVDERRPR